MNYKDNEGFTLIEMMVVIAVIGFLSAAVMASVSSARKKAKDSQIITDVQNAASMVEGLYDSTAGTYPVDLTAADFTAVRNRITNAGGTLSYVLDNTNKPASFAVYSKIVSDSSKYYCVSSNGTIVQRATAVPTKTDCTP